MLQCRTRRARCSSCIPPSRRPPTPLGDLALSHARLQADARYRLDRPDPAIAGARELEDLSANDRAALTEEIVLAGRAVRAVGQALGRPVEKLNVGQLGNRHPATARPRGRPSRRRSGLAGSGLGRGDGGSVQRAATGAGHRGRAGRSWASSGPAGARVTASLRPPSVSWPAQRPASGRSTATAPPSKRKVRPPPVRSTISKKPEAPRRRARRRSRQAPSDRPVPVRSAGRHSAAVPPPSESSSRPSDPGRPATEAADELQPAVVGRAGRGWAAHREPCRSR